MLAVHLAQPAATQLWGSRHSREYPKESVDMYFGNVTSFGRTSKDFLTTSQHHVVGFVETKLLADKVVDVRRQVKKLHFNMYYSNAVVTPAG